MHKIILTVAGAAALGACGQSADDSAANQAAANEAQLKKKKAAYCFFKDAETKDWAASRDKDGNITVKGKAYRSDSRYQAVLAPAEVSSTTAEIAPTIQNNATGFGAPENWWPVEATIPNSAAVQTVKVLCGQKTLAELQVPPKT